MTQSAIDKAVDRAVAELRRQKSAYGEPEFNVAGRLPEEGVLYGTWAVINGAVDLRALVEAILAQ